MKKVKYEEFWRALRAMQKELEERTGFPDIRDKIWFINTNDDEIKFALNFPSIREIGLNAAIKWADCIVEAVNLAKSFKYNGYAIDFSD